MSLLHLTPCISIRTPNNQSHTAQYSIKVKNALVFKDGFAVTCIPENQNATFDALTVIRGGGCGTEDMDLFRKLAHFSDFKLISEKKVVLVDQAWAYTYYHFIMEGFMRLFQFDNVKQLVENKNAHFIVPKSGHFDGMFGNRKFVEEIFEVMGVSKDRLITVSANQGLLVKHLEIPKPIFCGFPQPEQLQKAQSYFWEHFSKVKYNNSQSDARWILVMKRSTYRQIINHDEMLTSLQEWFPHETFKVFPENTSLKETVFLFSGAKLVIGPHGAGFGNLIFTRPPDKKNPLIVIEILQPGQLRLYCRASLFLGARYYGLLTEVKGKSPLIWFNVDVEEVALTIRQSVADAGLNVTYTGPKNTLLLHDVFVKMC